MAVDIYDLRYFYSGGGSNGDPDLSLGNGISTVDIVSQSTTAPSNVTGVTIEDAFDNSIGTGVLIWNDTTEYLYWQPPLSAYQYGTNITGDVTGLVLGGSDGYIVVDITYTSLPGSNQQDNITVTLEYNNVYDDVSATESLIPDPGYIDYRCLYLKNTHASDSAYNIKLFFATTPTPDTVYIWLDSSGLDGGDIGPLNDEEDSTDVLTSASWSTPLTSATGLDIGTMAAGETYAIWIKRNVPGDNRETNANDFFQLAVSCTIIP